MIYILLTLATLFTSIVSGVLSMAGGMILMGVFGFFLSVPAAMVLHGLAQAFSNGSRVWLHRRHIRWSVLIPYTAGAFVVLGIFSLFAFVPDMGLVFILIGSFPLLALLLPRSVNLDMERKPVAFASGIVVSAAQMLAGASGPVLDIFYVKSSLTRHEILGTKAVTQTLGHIIKLAYYSVFLGSVSQELPLWVFPAVVVAALGGNWIGKEVIERITDHQFKSAGRYVIMVIGFIYVCKGIYELINL
jgi:uncharacterized membrane protein YfcA